MNKLHTTKNNEAKTITYGGLKSQLFLWQKAFMLIPIWALVAIPLFGLLCRGIGPAATQAGYGILVALSAAYFIEDLLKRKIRMDDDYIFFGYRAVAIKELISIDLPYKKGKLLPHQIALTSTSGPVLKLNMDGLSLHSIETLLKHLQARNSQLKTAPVLSTLVKCRRTSKKPVIETDRRLEIPYHSRKFFEESFDVFMGDARNWIRMGPLLVCFIMAPLWMGLLSQIYQCLQPTMWTSMDTLEVQQFLYHLIGSLQQHEVNVAGAGATALSKFAEHPWVAFFASAFIAGFLYHLHRLLIRPNALVADDQGIKLGIRSAHLFVPLTKVRWDDVVGASLFKSGRQSGVESWKIRLNKRNGKRFELKLTALEPDDRARLLKRMEKHMPDCDIDAELSQSMLPKAERSYTEIWLQSLSQAPERKTLDPLAPGQTLFEDRFQVLKKLGVGGQGTAYMCSDMLSGQTVVLKETILPVFVEDAVRRNALERFENEARLLKSLDSHNTVKLMDYFIEDHRAYLVLEHIDGCNLRELVAREGALSEEQAVDIALQMCKILKVLHLHEIVHRDFTPDNLILNSQGKLKLIDFNVAQQLQTGTSGTIVGKHAYLPPEQFRGKATTQSDLYAFGATLFYLLAGKDPEPISQSSPASVNEAISSSLDEIVKRATALQANRRYQTSEEIESDLLRTLDGANDANGTGNSARAGVSDGVVLTVRENEMVEHG